MIRKSLIFAALSGLLGFGASAMAQEIPTTTPVPPPQEAPPAPPMPPPAGEAMPPAAATATTMAPEGNVTFTSHPGNSISPNYHVDFDAMDANHDGAISRAEARGNPDLMREFHVVDANHNGRLDRDEMKGWLD